MEKPYPYGSTDSVYLDAAGVVTGGEGILNGANLNAGADAATLTIHEGQNANGRIIVRLSANITESKTDGFGTGIFFKNGLYAVFTGTDPVGSIFWTPLSLNEIDT